MRCVDTSFLVDYLNGEPAAERWLESHEHQPLHTPTVALLEVYRGVLQADLPGGIDTASDGLAWIEPLPLTASAAEECALVEHELREAGKQINFADRLIAGIAREAGATLVTSDADFSRVSNLTVERYDHGNEN